jgi:hypothetical protein
LGEASEQHLSLLNLPPDGHFLGATVSRIEVVLDNEPDFPVTTTVDEPVAAFPFALKVTALDFVAGLAEYDTLTPLGRPDTDNVTLPVNPPAPITVIVLVTLDVCLTDKLAGEAESEKLAAGFTVRPTEETVEL